MRRAFMVIKMNYKAKNWEYSLKAPYPDCFFDSEDEAIRKAEEEYESRYNPYVVLPVAVVDDDGDKTCRNELQDALEESEFQARILKEKLKTDKEILDLALAALEAITLERTDDGGIICLRCTGHGPRETHHVTCPVRRVLALLRERLHDIHS